MPLDALLQEQTSQLCLSGQKPTTFLEDLQSSIFPSIHLWEEIQIQGHVKNEIGVWFSGATLEWSTGQVPTMAEGGWAVVLPAGEPQVLVLVSRRVGGCPPAGSRPLTCQKGTKEHPRPVTEAPED